MCPMHVPASTLLRNLMPGVGPVPRPYRPSHPLLHEHEGACSGFCTAECGPQLPRPSQPTFVWGSWACQASDCPQVLLGGPPPLLQGRGTCSEGCQLGGAGLMRPAGLSEGRVRGGCGGVGGRNPRKLGRLVAGISEGSPLPLTVKVRTGVSSGSINLPQVETSSPSRFCHLSLWFLSCCHI